MHSAFVFGQESLVAENVEMHTRGNGMPSGYLVNLLLKGLQFLSIEIHVDENGEERDCAVPMQLVNGTGHVCASTVEGEEEDRQKKGTTGGVNGTDGVPLRKEVKKKQRKGTKCKGKNRVFCRKSPKETSNCSFFGGG